MATAELPISSKNLDKVTASESAKLRACEELTHALNSGSVGEIVSKHEKLILQYYKDVQRHASESFKAAKLVAYIGFAVLILTWLYTLGFDIIPMLPGTHPAAPGNIAQYTGLVSGVLIEFIAGINFWLYSRASKQFGAFHICLERTHRYLVAFKIAEQAGERKDLVLEHIACIMASAPMIAGNGFDFSSSKERADSIYRQITKHDTHSEIAT